MKKLILFAAILFAGVSVVKAEGDNPEVKINGKIESDLTVNLYPIQSISIVQNEGALIEYKNATDYSGDGVSSKNNTSINVVSAGGYTIRVSADDFTTFNGSASLQLGTINVIASLGDNATGTAQSGVVLVKDEAAKLGSALIVGVNGGVDMKYNISFKGAGNNGYMRVYNAANNNEVQVYKTTVYYTIAAN